MESLGVYLPVDRRLALARGEDLPDRSTGAALFADVSGFTPLTEALARMLGPRRGAEELTRQLNRVYDALIDEVDVFGGSVIGFSGDAITCWFDDAALAEMAPAPVRATACALAMQASLRAVSEVPLPDGTRTTLAMKVAVASGPIRRFVVGNPQIQLMETLAGATLARLATGETLADKGEVILDAATHAALGETARVAEWRTDEESALRFAVVEPGMALSLPEVFAPTSVGVLPESDTGAWLLPAVYERMRQGLGEFLTELRPAVALFMRFEGIDYDGDDAAGAKLNAYVCWVQEVLTRFQGSLLQLTIGDKGSYIYAAFGAPVAHEDDARRAVSAALELRSPPPELNFIASVQVGMSQGTMRAGAYGSMKRRTYGVLGDEVNLAARLMQHAGPGEVLVSGRLQEQVASMFALESLPPIQVKGKRKPVRIAQLLGRQEGQADLRFYTGVLVGREAEVARLLDYLQPILEGQFAGVMYVYGEPGIGKSRLTYEVRQRIAHGHALRWHTFPAEGILRQSLHPFQRFLREFFDQRSDSPEERNRARFDEILDGLVANLQSPDHARPAEAGRLARELVRTRSFLGALAGGLRWEGSLYEQVEPKLRFENTLTACKALIQAEGLQQPVVVHIEDAHWLDADSEQMLQTLTRNIGGYPLAVLLTSRYRDDGTRYRLALDDDVLQAEIDLNELSPEAVRAMAAQVLEGELDDEVAAFLAEKTNGNPFFAEQLALDLRERGLLAARLTPAPDGGGSLRRFGFEDRTRIQEVPESVNAVLVARLDRLAAQVKAVVQTAAVLGQEFEIWVLSQMLSDDQALPAKVKEAEAEAIWSALTETRYLFKHALLRDAAYDMQLRARLRELHALAGAAIEHLYAEDVSPHAAILAYHWSEAEDTAKEAHYSVLAGDQALRTSAFRDALRYFTRALALLPADGEQEAGQRAALNYSIGEAYAGQGQLKEAQEHFRASLSLARARGDERGTASALSFLGGLDLYLGDMAQAEASLQESLALARAVQDERSLALTLNRLGHVARVRGDYGRAAQYYSESLDVARAVGAQMRMADALNSLGLAHYNLKNLAEAESRYREAQTLFRAMGNRTGVLMTLGNLGLVASEQGELAKARKLYEDALAITVEIGDRRLRAALLDNLGDVAYAMGADDEAARYLGESLKVALEAGVVSSALLTLAGIAKLRARAGQPWQALEILGAALHHPAHDDETRQRGEPLLKELQAKLPAEEVEAALERGRGKSLEVLAAEVLAAA